MAAQMRTVAVNSPELVTLTHSRLALISRSQDTVPASSTINGSSSISMFSTGIRAPSLNPLPEMMMLAFGATSAWLSVRLAGSTTMVVSLSLGPSVSTATSTVPDTPPGISKVSSVPLLFTEMSKSPAAELFLPSRDTFVTV